jgi:hypothetical protein
MFTIKIESQNDTLKGFRYFWMKRVTGFIPSAHCARCLSGSYVKEVGLRMPTNSEIQIPANEGDIFYLCGVSSPYQHVRNLHLAFQVKDGETAEVSCYTGDAAKISGAIKLPFDDTIAKQVFQNKATSFLTCRNFQFGAQYFLKS